VVTVGAEVPLAAVLESSADVAVESSLDVLVLESSALVALEDVSADDDEAAAVDTAACWAADDEVGVPMEPS
jgi:hypothetical protein